MGNEDAVAGQGVRERQGGDGIFGSAESGRVDNMDQQFRDFVRKLDLQEIEGEPFRRLVRFAHAEGLLEPLLQEGGAPQRSHGSESKSML